MLTLDERVDRLEVAEDPKRGMEILLENVEKDGLEPEQIEKLAAIISGRFAESKNKKRYEELFSSLKSMASKKRIGKDAIEFYIDIT